ncbi:hypothetical protein Nmel_016232, partial [Mimus melanotis]
KEGRSLKHNKQIGEKISTSRHGGGRKDFRRERESRTSCAKDDFTTAALQRHLNMEFQLRQSSWSYETLLLRKEMGREKPCGVQGAEIVILGLRNDENGTGFTLLGMVSITLEGEHNTGSLVLLPASKGR